MDFETLRTAIVEHQRERTFVNDKTAIEEIDKLLKLRPFFRLVLAIF
jgi:hypothetical protein